MYWKKLGLIFEIKKKHPLLLTHASNPLPIQIDDDIFRVFYSGRNSDNKSSVGYCDIDIEKRATISEGYEPLFTFGPENSFYEYGVSIGNIYQDNNKKNYILFMGWNIPPNEHWRGDIGRLELTDNKKLVLSPDIKFLTTDSEDKLSLSYPFVVFHEGIYKMWYGSTIEWETENGEMLHVIKYATSNNGIQWVKHGLAIPYELGVAQAFSRPSVIIDDKGYHLWYSYRSGMGTKYRIGYSHSIDGKTWERKHQEVGIDVSLTGWDSEMMCYPFVFEHKGKRYMFYNGNLYGKFGFGLAVLEQ